MKDPYNQLAGWAMEIGSYQAALVHKPGTKIAHADRLSRNPVCHFCVPLTSASEQEMFEKEPLIRNIRVNNIEEFRLAQREDLKLLKIINKILDTCDPEEWSQNYLCYH